MWQATPIKCFSSQNRLVAQPPLKRRPRRSLPPSSLSPFLTLFHVIMYINSFSRRRSHQSAADLRGEEGVPKATCCRSLRGRTCQKEFATRLQGRQRNEHRGQPVRRRARTSSGGRGRGRGGQFGAVVSDVVALATCVLMASHPIVVNCGFIAHQNGTAEAAAAAT